MDGKKLLVLVLCFAFLAWGGCAKKEGGTEDEDRGAVVKEYRRGPLSVEATLSSDQISIAETVELGFECTIEDGFELATREANDVLGDFEVVDFDVKSERLDSLGRVVSSYKYELEPMVTGVCVIGEIRFEFFDVNFPDEKRYELVTGEIEVLVASVLGGDVNDIAIADIEGVVGVRGRNAWIWVLGSIVFVCVGIIIFLRRRGREELGEVRRYLRADTIAFERLEKLKAEGFLESGRVKKFYERISNILRYYIEDRFELRAPERTTEEFLGELKYSNCLGDGEKEEIGEFLRHCDMVKFARFKPEAEQVGNTYRVVNDFVERTGSEEKVVDVTDKDEVD